MKRYTIFVQFFLLRSVVPRNDSGQGHANDERNEHTYIIIGFNKVSRVGRVFMNFQKPSRANISLKIKIIFTRFSFALYVDIHIISLQLYIR